MTSDTNWNCVVVVLLTLLAGCQFGADGTPTATPGPLEEGRIDAVPDHLNHNDEFYYAGSIRFVAPASASSETFEDVTLCLYDGDGNVLNSTIVGTVTGRFDNATFAISSDERPAYIVFDHPKFHDYETMYPRTLFWTEHGYYQNSRASVGSIQNDFEYPRHNETGRCL